jgi:hypothetical protein
MLTEAFHRSEAERVRRIAEAATSALIEEKLIKIAELHARVADGLQQAASQAIRSPT